MKVSEAIVKALKDSGKGIQWLADKLEYNQSSGISNMIARGGATVETLCHICNILGYTLVMEPLDESKEKIVLEANKERIKRRSGTKGRELVNYDVKLFEHLYAQVESGEITIKDAVAKLGVNYAKWHRLSQSKKNKE